MSALNTAGIFGYDRVCIECGMEIGDHIFCKDDPDGIRCPEQSKPEAITNPSAHEKLASYLRQENEVLHAKIRQLETKKEEHVWTLTRALWNCRATAILEQENPSGAHLTAFSLIQKYATEALGDGGLE